MPVMVSHFEIRRRRLPLRASFKSALVGQCVVLSTYFIAGQTSIATLGRIPVDPSPAAPAVPSRQSGRPMASQSNARYSDRAQRARRFASAHGVAHQGDALRSSALITDARSSSYPSLSLPNEAWLDRPWPRRSCATTRNPFCAKQSICPSHASELRGQPCENVTIGPLPESL